ncbi:bifunctional oligoribonuclease/PAP phosphatase NrnA [Candidatus Latescibacterota bacterium]
MAMANECSVEYKKVSDFLDRCQGRKLLIQTHDIPDPDALASAEAFRVFAKSRGISARIVVNGLPHRHENLALIKECKIPMTMLGNLNIKNPDKYRWAYIDCFPGNRNVTLHRYAPGDDFVAIDHHRKSLRRKRLRTEGVLISNPGAGATATILTSLLFTGEVIPPVRLASALSYAIITDTMDFSRGTAQEDLDSFKMLFPYTNQRIISRLRNATKSRHYFQTMRRSLDKAAFYRHVAWANMGVVSGGEIAAEMADFILTCERISWSLALGFCGSRLYMSLRSSNPKAQCGLVIARLLEHRRGAAGGHDQFAGGFIELGSSVDADRIADEVIERFVRILLRIPQKEPVPEGTLLAGE